MAEEQETAQRKAARRKMHEALELLKGKHPEHGVDAMREALEIDPDFIEPRRALARYYLETDQKRLAVSQYEEMLRIDPDNDELWAELRKIDPMTAERLDRLQHIAPDPFVAQRKDVDMSDLEDFEVEDEPVEEEAAGPAPFLGNSGGGSDDLFLEEEDDYDYEPLPWEHEQEADYRERLDQNAPFVDVMDGYALFWQDSRGRSRLVAPCSAPEDVRWDTLEGETATAATELHTRPPDVLVLHEHTRLPIALPLKSPMLVIGETYHHALSNQEVLFVLGFGIHLLQNDNAAYLWAAEHIIQREVEDSDLRQQLTQAAADFTVGWDAGLPQEERTRLAKLAHAWEMRSALSADRAGLICCGEINCACRAIAAMCSASGEASMISADDFLEQFSGIPAAELANIGLAHDPWTDPRYAAYRIQMIRWWATTDHYKQVR